MGGLEAGRLDDVFEGIVENGDGKAGQDDVQESFGLTLMCGIGGIYTELYKDVSFRVVPIDRYDAEHMVEEIKGKKLLEGFRNIPADKKLVIDLLLKVSKIGEELFDHISEMDFNPVFVYGDDYCVVDAKLILK